MNDDADVRETLDLLEVAKARLRAIEASGDEAAIARATVLTLDLLRELKNEMGLGDLSLHEFLLALFRERQAQEAHGKAGPN